MHEGRDNDDLVPARWRGMRIESLEGKAWGDAPPDATGLVRSCHELRRVPLSDLTDGQIRRLLGQDIGSKFLVPLALEMLRTDPYLEADCYPGDLLENVCRRIAGGTALHRAAREQARELVENLPLAQMPKGLDLPGVIEKARQRLAHS